MTTLDQLASEEALQPALVKIDVEGYELEVLRGAEKLLAAGAAFIVEIHPPQLKVFQVGDEEVVKFLTQSGFQVEVIDRNPNTLYTILATKP
jgi:hypothetical protein